MMMLCHVLPTIYCDLECNSPIKFPSAWKRRSSIILHYKYRKTQHTLHYFTHSHFQVSYCPKRFLNRFQHTKFQLRNITEMLFTYAVSAICLFFPCTELPPESGYPPADPTSNHQYPQVLTAPAVIIQDYEKNTTEIDRHSHFMTQFHDNPNIIIPRRQNPQVYLRNGRLRGFHMKTVSGREIEAFQSIPFAQPPVGSLRFREPVPNFSWRGIRDAIEPAPSCIQTDFIQQYKIIGQEDCLYLSVYKPIAYAYNPNLHGLPVMVFIHGGGFFFGSSNLYGPSYLLEHDVILVTINYRLGPLGFLSLGDTNVPGNVGLKDQVMALRWVQENIHAFGGDHRKVTIFGESAGAGSVHYHMLSPLSRGLFHRGISESGCALCFWSISERGTEISNTYSSRLNCTGSSQEILECLQTKNSTDIVATQLSFLEWGIYPVVIFGPVLEPHHSRAFLADLPEDIYKNGAAAPVPWISGFNSDEGAINIATLLLNPESVAQLNEKWDEFGPIFLDLKHSTENATAVANKARQYYMGSDKFSFETRDKAGQLFSDRYTAACGIKGLRYHAKYSGAPTYTYYLSYRGNYSYVQLLGQKAQDWGVSHLDDLIYLLNNTAHYSTLKLEDEEWRISQIITNMWVNFADLGVPLLTIQGKDKGVWKPLDRREDSEIRFLNIDLNPFMIRNPFEERARLWQSFMLTNE